MPLLHYYICHSVNTSALDLLHTEAVNIGLKLKLKRYGSTLDQQPVPSITLHGQILPWSRSERYIGIELDRNMTLTQQANFVAAKSKRNMNAMKCTNVNIWTHTKTCILRLCSIHFGARSKSDDSDVQDQYQNATKNPESRHAIDFRGA